MITKILTINNDTKRVLKILKFQNTYVFIYPQNSLLPDRTIFAHIIVDHSHASEYKSYYQKYKLR